METKHTPGPWEMSYDKGSTRDIIASKDNAPVCTTRQAWISREAYQSNSRLIASAPELLDELLMLCNMLEGEQVSVGIEAQVCFARAVIAKATGLTANV